MGDDERPKSRKSWLEEALPGVRPMAGRGRRVVPASGARPRKPEPEAGSAVFELSQDGERLEGRAPGIDRAHVRRLRRGEVDADRVLDWHGLLAEEARRQLRAALAQALAEGKRCLLVVHGRGHHSTEEPVLKRRLPEWLAEPPHGKHVLAFASAPASRGGTGATFVLLRRPRGGELS